MRYNLLPRPYITPRAGHINYKMNKISTSRTKFQQSIKDFFLRFHFPIFLLGLTVLAYGLYATSLGFFLDDWYIARHQNIFGGSGFFQFFQEDRPFLAYVYRIFVPIFGDNPTAWQIFALFTRWLTAVSFWVVLNNLFPAQKKIWKWSAILFLIYPGFQFHWFAIMYSQVYFLMAVYFISFLFMQKAIISRNSWWTYAGFTLASLICLIIGIVPMEYFYGIELIRPVVLWFILRRIYPQPLKTLGRTLLHWLPYLAVYAGFTGYRILYSSKYSYQVGILNQFSGDPVTALLDLVSKIFWSVYDAALAAWWNLIQLFNRELRASVSKTMLILIFISGLIVFLVLSRKDNLNTEERKKSYGWVVMLCGLLLTLFALIPFTAASFEVSLEFPNNRFLLALSPGIALFIAGAAEEFLRTEKQKIIVVAVLSGLAVGSQFIASNGYKTHWNAQEDFFWQLTWRAPALEPGTALVSEDLPFSKYFSGTSLSAPLNMIYDPGNKTSNLNYHIILTSSPLGDAIPSYDPGIPFEISYRGLDFHGNTNDLIVFYKPPKGCLRLLSSEVSPDEFRYSDRAALWAKSIPRSNLDLIITNPTVPAVPDAKYFGEENTNQWCYYFEKADLARQQQDWTKVIEIYDQAGNAGFSPGNIPEWLPLMEAYFQTGQVDLALQINNIFAPTDPTETATLCRLLQRTAANPALSADDNDRIMEIINLHKCQDN